MKESLSNAGLLGGTHGVSASYTCGSWHKFLFSVTIGLRHITVALRHPVPHMLGREQHVTAGGWAFQVNTRNGIWSHEPLQGLLQSWPKMQTLAGHRKKPRELTNISRPGMFGVRVSVRGSMEWGFAVITLHAKLQK